MRVPLYYMFINGQCVHYIEHVARYLRFNSYYIILVLPQQLITNRKNWCQSDFSQDFFQFFIRYSFNVIYSIYNYIMYAYACCAVVKQ